MVNVDFGICQRGIAVLALCQRCVSAVLAFLNQSEYRDITLLGKSLTGRWIYTGRKFRKSVSLRLDSVENGSLLLSTLSALEGETLLGFTGKYF